jgi:hypothetical protein
MRIRNVLALPDDVADRAARRGGLRTLENLRLFSIHHNARYTPQTARKAVRVPPERCVQYPSVIILVTASAVEHSIGSEITSFGSGFAFGTWQAEELRRPSGSPGANILN